MRSKFKWIFALLLAFSMQFSFAQEKTITGTVTEGGLPLPGVSVVVKGTTRGTQTDMDGNYSIKAATGESLVFSFIGMKDQTMVVGAANKMNVAMAAESTTLENVVVTALGIKRKVDALTSSNQVVKAQELTQAANPNVVQSLAGKVSGLQINTTSNGVNGSTRIVLRGNRSISGNNQALVVIDNVISSATVLQQLPPEIIESTNILKGAQGAALYGQDGVNGVIIVNTKRGAKSGKLNVSVNSAIDFETVNYFPQRQQRYGQGWNGEHITYENGGWGPEFDGSMQPVGLPQADGSFVMAPYSPIEDNIKEFFQTGTVFQNGVSISGGDLESGYALLSANKVDTEFVVQDDKMNRTNFLFKGGKKFGRFTVEGNANYITQKTSATSAGLYEDLLQTATNIPVDQFSNPNNATHWTYYYLSPFWIRENVRSENRSDYFNGIATLGFEINKHINVSYVANIQTRQTSGMSYNNGYVDVIQPDGPNTSQSQVSNYYSNNSSTRNYYGDLLINFDYDLAKDLNLKVNLGNNLQDNLFKVTSVGGENLDIPGFYHITNVLNPDNFSTLDNRTVRSRKFSFFGQADLNYKDYLFLNVTGRNDWTSVLDASGNNFFYPSAGISFVPTKAFEGLKGKVLNYAKASASYVKVGNTSVIAPYGINEIGVSPVGYPFGDLNSFVNNQAQTYKNIKPEFMTTLEATVNLGFFNDRLTLDASYSNTDTKDLITRVTASSASGLASNLLNIGKMNTKAYEVDLGFTPIKTEDFKWEGRVSYTSSKAIVEKVSDDAKEINLQSNTFVGIFAAEGEEFPLIKGTAYVRDEQGRVMIDAETGNPMRTSTFQKLGSANPDYILGFNNAFEYKGIRLSAVMDFRTGHKFYSEVKRELSWSGHLVESAENGRTGFIFPNSSSDPDGDGVYTANNTVMTGGTTYQDYLNYFSNEYSRTGENFVLDGTAFKVRELALSYSLPSKMIERAGLSTLRFGVNARNPFVVLPKENRGYSDPETSNTTGNATGIANIGQYPATRTLGFSMNLTF
ncbi:SusC/RagA family TonB-linked outer membrane protein [Flavobacterium enshiense]|uniref:SusC/RagA family TonB-linked outer membrane protein n=1 Tax=Flavobacterium enshiense TaxID=1341165 RepID=UPI00345D6E1B